MDPNVKMGDKERLQLNNMLKENDVLDQTELIRELKHSVIFKKEVALLLNLMKKYPSDPEALHAEAMIECSFLFSYYTDLYNKIRKNEIDIKILYQFIDVLANIEEGNVISLVKLISYLDPIKKVRHIENQELRAKTKIHYPETISELRLLIKKFLS